MTSHEHRRSRRHAQIEEHAPDPAAAALSRAIMLARVIKWREEWQAEIASRRMKPNGHMGATAASKSARRDGGDAPRFAAGVARNEFGRFYWDEKLERALTNARKDRAPKKPSRRKKPK